MSSDGLTDSSGVDVDVEGRIAQAQRKVVFLDRNLTLTTENCMPPRERSTVLQYGSGCWAPLRKNINKLNSFHYRCIRTILRISNGEWVSMA